MSPQFLHWALQTEFSKAQNCKTITAPSSQQLCSDYQCNFFKSLNIHLRGFETSLVPKVILPDRPNAKVSRKGQRTALKPMKFTCGEVELGSPQFLLYKIISRLCHLHTSLS